MPKFTIAVRGGLPNKFGNEIEDMISELNLQDDFFVIDVKTHSIELFIIHDQIGPLVHRIQGRFNLSIIKTEYLNQNTRDAILFMGKLQDSGVVKTMQNQATGLFGK